jgi:protein-S-isoprenylcysteine O-methyltransferase Ste14
MIVQMIARTVVFLAFLGALLMVPAGTWWWPNAWLFLAVFGLSGIAVGLWLAAVDPELLRERMQFAVRAKQSFSDRIIMSVTAVLFFVWLAAMGYDVRLHGQAMVPQWLSYLGAAALAACFAGALGLFRVNRFAVPVVKVQAEREHAVISTGPYAYVRHPMYAGALVFFIAMPLTLGSWRGLLALPVLALALAVRTIFEERTLRHDLAGYGEYMTRVRWRLVPYLW